MKDSVNWNELQLKDGVYFYDETPYSGKVFAFYDNGQKSYEHTLEMGKYHGLSTSWYEKGGRSLEVIYQEGKVHGHQTDWYENGVMKSKSYYQDDEMVLFENWYESGQKEKELTHDTMTEWRRNGNKRTQKIFVGDQTKGLSGTWTKYYESGEKYKELNYKDGKLNGLAIKWYKNGQKASESTFNAAQRPSVIVWNPNGEKCSETNFKNGSGTIISYDDKGSVLSRNNYNEGNLDGICFNSYRNGQKKEESVYKNGKLYSQVAWRMNGANCPLTNIQDGNGQEVFYDSESGVPLMLNCYKNGEKENIPISDWPSWLQDEIS